MKSLKLNTMKRTTKTALAATTTALAVLTCQPVAHGQSADSLINKLVQKGILTTQEARDLQQETKQDFTKAFSAKIGLPDWVTGMKFGGDLRLRLDSIQSQGLSIPDRNRYRYRIRVGTAIDLKDDWQIGVFLTSSDPDATDAGKLGQAGDPISQNASFKDNGGKKWVFFDKVYARWTPIKTSDWLAVSTLGKMDNPFHFPSTMVFDKDYTPEGFSQELTHHFTKDQTVKLVFGGFALDEIPASNNDPVLLASQLRWDARWTPAWSTTLGVAGLSITGTRNLSSGNVPDIGQGNTRNAAGVLQGRFNDFYVDGGVTWKTPQFPFYRGEFPVTLSGDYLHNLSQSSDNVGYSVGLQLGKAGKKGQWELNYRWTSLQGNAWYEEMAESDFGGFYAAAPVAGQAAGYRSGTNVRGHWVKGSYAFTDAVTFSVAYFLTELIHPSPANSDSGAGRLFVEAVWKF